MWWQYTLLELLSSWTMVHVSKYWRPPPSPIKNGSYGVEVGFVCHIFAVHMPFFCWSPFILRHFLFVRGLIGTGPPDPTLESASPSLIRGRFGIKIESNQEIDVESMSSRCWTDAEPTPEEGRARRIRGWGPGGLCLINPSQFYVMRTLVLWDFFCKCWGWGLSQLFSM